MDKKLQYLFHGGENNGGTITILCKDGQFIMHDFILEQCTELQIMASMDFKTIPIKAMKLLVEYLYTTNNPDKDTVIDANMNTVHYVFDAINKMKVILELVLDFMYYLRDLYFEYQSFDLWTSYIKNFYKNAPYVLLYNALIDIFNKRMIVDKSIDVGLFVLGLSNSIVVDIFRAQQRSSNSSNDV